MSDTSEPSSLNSLRQDAEALLSTREITPSGKSDTCQSKTSSIRCPTINPDLDDPSAILDLTGIPIVVTEPTEWTVSLSAVTTNQ
jgi:hypothetical protein